jgi:LysM repeat protein
MGKRLFYYLLLNVLVSACTTFLVLSYWDRTHGPVPGSMLPFPAQGNAAGLETPTAEQPTAVVQNPAVALAPTPTTTFMVYQVESGDDFASIAAQFGVSVEELIAVNGFTKNQPLGTGEVLRIPVAPEAVAKADIEIESVLGAEDLASERVVLRQVGSGDLLLSGWQLEDEQGNVFVFPYIELVKDGFELEVFTKDGTNSANKIYWGLSQPVWSTGERVILRDAAGEERSSFTVQ